MMLSKKLIIFVLLLGLFIPFVSAMGVSDIGEDFTNFVNGMLGSIFPWHEYDAGNYTNDKMYLDAYHRYCEITIPYDRGTSEYKKYEDLCSRLKVMDSQSINDRSWVEIFKAYYGNINDVNFRVLDENINDVNLTSDTSVKDLNLLAYNKKKDLMLSSVNVMYNNFNLFFSLLISTITILYYFFELVFFVWLFLDFIPNQILKFRDVLVKYFIKRL